MFTPVTMQRALGIVLLLILATGCGGGGGGGGDSSTATPVPPPEPPVSTFTISGRLDAPAGQSLDGDTNDPLNELLINDDRAQPQPLVNPVTLGGYVNEAGAGAEGRSQIDGDPEDFFELELLAGQRINLLVAEPVEGDADLYLYNDSGELVDFSVATGELEDVRVPENGRYVVNVSIFSGATNYTLAIGVPLTPSQTNVRRSLHQPIVLWQAIIEYEDGRTVATSEPPTDALRRWGARQIGGGRRRARLLGMSRKNQDLQALRERLGRQLQRRSEFDDEELAARWETLMTIKRLKREPGVLSAEPNYRLQLQATVNDDAYPFQWHYPLINLPGAWDTTTGSAEVIVAVIDSGVLGGHPDLAGQLVPGYDFIRDAQEAADGDGIDPDPEESIGDGDPAALNYHGTHVAGTVAARGNNAIGVAGVAFGARVMPIRALAATGGTSYDVRQAIRFAARLDNDSGTLPEKAADIINLSLGGEGFSQISQNLYNELRDLDIVVVAAAGNEGSSRAFYPAGYDNVISVSAVDVEQNITAYSNRGDAIDIAAPGGNGSQDINGDGYPDGVLSTGANAGEFAYTFLSGTSMAAPHVAGVFALMKSANPTLNADQIDALLREGRLSQDRGDPGRDDLYGHGLIDARRAVDAALVAGGEASQLPPRLSASTSALNFSTARTTLDVNFSNSGGGEITVQSIAADQAWIQVAAESVDNNGLGRYRVSVDRAGLSAGIYEGNVTAVSSVNNAVLRVLLAVADESQAEFGTLYLLIYDPETEEVVQQALVRNTANGYSFSFSSVPAGDYQFIAGTDLDNDLTLCDAGEACGAYITVEQPIIVSIDGNRDDIVFPIEYLIALPLAADSDGLGQGRIPELKRKEIVQ